MLFLSSLHGKNLEISWRGKHNQLSRLVERGSHFSNGVNPLRSRKGETQANDLKYLIVIVFRIEWVTKSS